MKPLLRGWFHLAALPVVAVLGLTLVALADGQWLLTAVDPVAR